MEFCKVITSPMRRAKETCRLAGLLASAEIEAGLSEWDYGNYEGETSSVIRSLRPGWNLFRDGCPGG